MIIRRIHGYHKPGVLYNNNFKNIENSIGYNIIVSRHIPKNFDLNDVYCWKKELAPSERLLSLYQRKVITKDKFKEMYIEEISMNQKASKEIFFIKRLIKNGNDVTILCHENKDQFCHRHILAKEILELETINL